MLEVGPIASWAVLAEENWIARQHKPPNDQTTMMSQDVVQSASPILVRVETFDDSQRINFMPRQEAQSMAISQAPMQHAQVPYESRRYGVWSDQRPLVELVRPKDTKNPPQVVYPQLKPTPIIRHYAKPPQTAQYVQSMPVTQQQVIHEREQLKPCQTFPKVVAVKSGKSQVVTPPIVHSNEVYELPKNVRYADQATHNVRF